MALCVMAPLSVERSHGAIGNPSLMLGQEASGPRPPREMVWFVNTPVSHVSVSMTAYTLNSRRHIWAGCGSGGREGELVTKRLLAHPDCS